MIPEHVLLPHDCCDQAISVILRVMHSLHPLLKDLVALVLTMSIFAVPCYWVPLVGLRL